MDLFQAITGRRSIRKFKPVPVEPAKIKQVLNMARLAPSWKNLQCWRFLVLTQPGPRALLAEAFPGDNPGKNAVASAPCIIVVCAEPAESGVENGIEYFVADTALAFDHLCLAAHGLGLGTCWMGWFNELEIKRVLDIPEGIRVVGVTPLGYPDQSPNPRPRKELAQVAFSEKWGAPLQ